MGNEKETYPLQNGCKDQIDQFLWDEMGLLPGCCSSIEELKYSIARETAEKMMEKMIKKAEVQLYRHNCCLGATLGSTNAMQYCVDVEQFKQEMKD